MMEGVEKMVENTLGMPLWCRSCFKASKWIFGVCMAEETVYTICLWMDIVI